MKGPERRRAVVDACGDDELLFADGFDDALIGYLDRACQPPIAVYDRERVLEVLMAEGATYEEALEHYGFNVSGAWVGEQTPAFLVRTEELEEATPPSRTAPAPLSSPLPPGSATGHA